METVIVNNETLDAQFVEVSPALARSLLGQNYEKNRPLSKNNVRSFVYRIKTGQFRQGTVIELVRNGLKDILIDGQHRLAAIEETGLSQQMLILSRTTKDIDKEYALADGAGKSRTIKDSLKALGITDSEVIYAVSALRLIDEKFYPGGYKGTDVNRNKWRHDRLMVVKAAHRWTPVIKKYWADSEAVERSGDFRIKKNPGFMGVALLCYREHPEKSKEFFSPVIEGLNLVRHTPAYALRKMLDDMWYASSKVRGQVKATQVAGLTAAAWNKYALGQEVRKRISPADPNRLRLITNYEV